MEPYEDVVTDGDLAVRWYDDGTVYIDALGPFGYLSEEVWANIRLDEGQARRVMQGLFEFFLSRTREGSK